MNDLATDQKPDFEIMGAFSVIAVAATRAADNGDFKEAWKCLHAGADLFINAEKWTTEVADLYGMAAASVTSSAIRNSSELIGAHPAFRAQLSDLLPGARIANDRIVPDGQCDFLVSVEGELRPVEIKRDSFRPRHIIQLRRYMSRYRSSIGYAAAPHLGCELPADMIFLKLQWIS